jgi:glutamyl-tRNA reductase
VDHMRVGVVGVNHKSADLQLRELLAKACQKRFCPGGFAHGEHAFILLSTCNRTEVYFSSEDLADTHIYLLRVLRQEVSIEFEHKLYSYFGSDCFNHLSRVTAGMDSAILAETEIQGQVKNAYELAAKFGSLPRDLHFMFQKCLKIGKEIRTSFPATRRMASIEDAVLQVGQTSFLNFVHKKVLFVGVSEINCRILMAMRAHGIHDLTLCNRTEEKASALALKENIAFLPWKNLFLWHHYDVILFGTKSPEFLVNKKDLIMDMPENKLVIDLSVPRNVEPVVGRHPQITLLNIDQINQQVDKIRRLKKIEVNRIEKLVSEKSEQQTAAFQYKERLREAHFNEPKLVVLGF